MLTCPLHRFPAAKVFHRDLKPKNILANSDCKLKVRIWLQTVADKDTTLVWPSWNQFDRHHLPNPGVRLWAGAPVVQRHADHHILDRLCRDAVVSELSIVTI